MTGIPKLNEAAQKKYSKDFMELAAAEKHDLLVAVDGEMKEYNKNKKEGDLSIIFP